MTDPASDIAGLYERHALAWDRDRNRTLFERAWLDRFLAAMPPGAPVLDLGCGSGEPIAAYLIGRGLAVTGVDSSPTLIGLCRRRFSQGQWLVGDMRTLDLDTRFGGILAWDSFFHLASDDQRAMFAVFARHAMPGAALMFTSGPEEGEAIGSYRGDALYHASLAPQAYRALLDEHGFQVVRHEAEDANCAGHTVWLARRDQP